MTETPSGAATSRFLSDMTDALDDLERRTQRTQIRKVPTDAVLSWFVQDVSESGPEPGESEVIHRVFVAAAEAAVAQLKVFMTKNEIGFHGPSLERLEELTRLQDQE